MNGIIYVSDGNACVDCRSVHMVSSDCRSHKRNSVDRIRRERIQQTPQTHLGIMQPVLVLLTIGQTRNCPLENFRLPTIKMLLSGWFLNRGTAVFLTR